MGGKAKQSQRVKGNLKVMMNLKIVVSINQ